MSRRLTKKELEKILKEKEEKIKELETLLEKSTKERDEYLDLLRRVTADFDNYRKRVAQREEEMRKFAGENFMRSILPVIDDLERALNHMRSTSTLKDLKKGVEMIYKKFCDFLKSHNVERMKVVGEEFNPHFHEALMVEGEGEGKEVVLEELEPGYLMHGKLLRPAKVKVQKRKESQNET